MVVKAPLKDSEYLARIASEIAPVFPTVICKLIAGFMNATNELLFKSVMLELKKLRVERYFPPGRKSHVHNIGANLFWLLQSAKHYENGGYLTPILAYESEYENDQLISIVNPMCIHPNNIACFARLR